MKLYSQSTNQLCVGKRQTLFVILTLQRLPAFFFPRFETGSLIGLELSWFAAKSQGPAYLCLSSTRIKIVYSHTWLFKCGIWALNLGHHADMADT